MEQIQCAYCGKIKKEVIFIIGAAKKPDWCMIEGTGKMTCPDCYSKASQEGQEAIAQYVELHNKRAEKALMESNSN